MPETTLRDVVLKRLDEVADGDNHWYPLVLAALEGQGELRKQLDEAGSEDTTAPVRHPEPGSQPTGERPAISPPFPPQPRIAFLSKLTVEGFRGLGPKATLEGPSKLHDALAKIRGLDDLVQAQDALQQERAARDKALKDADKERKEFVAKLAAVADDRAKQAHEALQRKDDWGLATVEAIVAGTAPGDPATLVPLQSHEVRHGGGACRPRRRGAFG